VGNSIGGVENTGLSLLCTSFSDIMPGNCPDEAVHPALTALQALYTVVLPPA